MLSISGFQYLIAWALLSQQAIAAADAAAAQQNILEEIIAGLRNVPEQIATVLQQNSNTEILQPHAIEPSLAQVGLPIPPEIRDLAAQGKKVTAAQADHATETLNKMLTEQHWLLDHKVIDCREKRRSAGEAIQQAAAEVRNLASETSSARGIIVEATSRIPQDRRSFGEFKAEVQISRSRCRDASVSDNVKAKSLERSAIQVAAIQAALVRQCKPKATSFLQGPTEVDDIIADAEKTIADVDGPEPMHLSQAAAATVEPAEEGVDDIIASAENALSGGSVVHAAAQVKKTVHAHVKKVGHHAHRKKALKEGDCTAIAAALGVVAQKRGAHSALALLQDLPVEPNSCKLTAHKCAAMHDVAAEVAGEIADSQARLKASSAATRDACQEEELFGKNQLAMETSQASDRSRELGEATLKAGQVGDMTIQKDAERQQMQKELKAITGKCTVEIKDILYGKMCALQKVRDSLQILAGRTELPEDCQVTDWEEGVCSATCGGGMKTMNRKVTLSPKGGAECPPLALTVHCGETACPKDCEVSGWSNFSACSARCDGGVQERNRHVTQNPIGNGVACPHLVDMRLCNSESCTSDCEFLQWTAWGSCSKACDAGSKSRSRGLRDEGKASCPSADHKDRLEFQECNKDACAAGNDVRCAGDPMDMVLLLDASGSMTQEGFATIKSLSQELVRYYNPSANGTKLSIASFAKEATAIAGLSENSDALQSSIASNLQWLQGPGNAASGISRAATLMANGGRKTASSVVLMVTDGRLVDPYLARQAAERLKKSGVRLAFALVGADARNIELLKSMASLPKEDNFIKLPHFDKLPEYLKWSAKRIISGTCSAVEPLPVPA